jgi:hypothetical protein
LGHLDTAVQDEETPLQKRHILKKSLFVVWQNKHLLVRQFIEQVPSAYIAMVWLHLRMVMFCSLYSETL